MKIIERIIYHKNRYGYINLTRIVFYPITLLLWGPYRLFVTLWNARVLANGKWSNYIGFKVDTSINHLFYWTQAVNIDRYGRNGVSPHLGLGDYYLGKWWHLSLPSTYLYKSWGAILPLYSLFAWLSIHFLWLDGTSVEYLWGFIVLGLALIGTTFFAQAFSMQNYNAAGWVFFPLGVWGLVNGHYLIAALTWMAAGFGSMTVVVLASMLTILFIFQIGSPIVLVTIFPAGFKLLLHLYWGRRIDENAKKKVNLKDSLSQIAKAIGLINVGIKYQRKSSKKLSLTFIYFLLLYLQYGLIQWVVEGQYVWLWLGGVCIFITNTLFARFADPQSIYIMMFSLATFMTLTQQNIWLLISYWFVVSPIPNVFGDGSREKMPDTPKPLKPYCIRQLIECLEKFLVKVNSNEKVLFAFDDPNNTYENIFDGYRVLFEAPLYVATEKRIHMFPDWWAVLDNNYCGAKEFWGRDVMSVNKNVKEYQPDYVIVYQESGSKLCEDFPNNGYTLISELDWNRLANELEFEKPWLDTCSTPKWWLLKVPDGLKE